MDPLLPRRRAHLSLEGARQLAVEDGQGLGEVEGAHVEAVGVDELEGKEEGKGRKDEGKEEGGVVLKKELC